VVIPEYSHFAGTSAYGRDGLLRTVVDVARSDLKRLRPRQYLGMIPILPRYAFSKLKPTEYLYVNESGVYGAKSFNEYGDETNHWKLAKREVSPHGQDVRPFAYSVVEELNDFGEKIKKRSGFVCLISGVSRDFI